MAQEQKTTVVVEEDNKPYQGLVGDISILEREVEDLEKERTQQVEAEQQEQEEEREDSTLSAEEANWKGRYGNLRAHAEKEKQERLEQVTVLKAELEEIRKSEKIEFPTSEEDLVVFSEKFPDVFNAITTLIMKNTQESTKAAREELAEIRVDIAKAKRKTSEEQLRVLHPDLEVLQNSEEFKVWALDQPERIKTILFGESDVAATGKLLDMFKTETGYGKRKPGRPKKETKIDDVAAALQVKGKGNREPVEDSKRTWKESDIAALDVKEYEKFAEEIDLANRKGEIVRDLTS